MKIEITLTTDDLKNSNSNPVLATLFESFKLPSLEFINRATLIQFEFTQDGRNYVKTFKSRGGTPEPGSIVEIKDKVV